MVVFATGAANSASGKTVAKAIVRPTAMIVFFINPPCGKAFPANETMSVCGADDATTTPTPV